MWNQERKALYRIITRQAEAIYRLAHWCDPQPGPAGRPPLATKLVLKSILINGQIKIEGTIMSLNLLPNQYVIGTLAPIAGQDAQGSNIPSEIKAGSLVTYSSSNPNAGAISANPGNPLQFKLQVPAGAAAGLQSNIGFSGLNDNGDTISGTDDLTVAAGGGGQPPLATGFAVSYTAPADATLNPPPF